MTNYHQITLPKDLPVKDMQPRTTNPSSSPYVSFPFFKFLHHSKTQHVTFGFGSHIQLCGPFTGRHYNTMEDNGKSQ